MQEYILIQTTTDLDPPKRVRHIAFIFANSGLFIENEGRFLINFTITTYQIKFNYRLQTLYAP